MTPSGIEPATFRFVSWKFAVCTTPARGVDYLTQSSAYVQNEGVMFLLPLHVFMSCSGTTLLLLYWNSGLCHRLYNEGNKEE